MSLKKPQYAVVRLSEMEQQIIRDVIEEACLNFSVVLEQIALFGSRTDLAKRGGDIDLYVKLASRSDFPEENDLKREIRMILCDKLGEQKIDIIVDYGQDELDHFRPIIMKQLVDL